MYIKVVAENYTKKNDSMPIFSIILFKKQQHCDKLAYCLLAFKNMFKYRSCCVFHVDIATSIEQSREIHLLQRLPDTTMIMSIHQDCYTPPPSSLIRV